jgi:DNA-binding beta-propeller fold protein YncE
LKLVQTIPLPGVEGRIDHLTVDLKTQKLFVAALGNDTVEIVDLAQGKRVRSITGLSEPQGVVFVHDINRLFVANGGDGTLRVFDGSSFAMVANVKLGADADNVRYDPAANTVVAGYGNGGLALLNVQNMKVAGNVKLSGHPESFQLDKSSSRIYVNVPDANHIAVVDRGKQTVTATWPMDGLHSNFPMALDEADHLLFIGTRNPARLVVFDTASGKQIAVVNCSGDADDIFYNSQRRQIYVAAGEGFIDVFKQQGTNQYQRTAQIPTVRGARTALFVPELQRFYLAVPKRGTQEAAVRVYEVTQP